MAAKFVAAMGPEVGKLAATVGIGWTVFEIAEGFLKLVALILTVAVLYYRALINRREHTDGRKQDDTET